MDALGKQWIAPFALLPRLDPRLGGRRAVPEAKRFVAGFDDVAVMRQPVEQRRRHLGIAEDTRPFGKGQVGRDHHAGVFVEFRQ